MSVHYILANEHLKVEVILGKCRTLWGEPERVSVHYILGKCRALWGEPERVHSMELLVIAMT